MGSYTPLNLKEQFPELKALQDFTLIPLLDLAFYSWLKQLPNSAVSDIRKDRDSHHESYSCVVNGKIVKVNATEEDIDVCDEDETWSAVRDVSFDGDGVTSRRLFEEFRNFSGG